MKEVEYTYSAVPAFAVTLTGIIHWTGGARSACRSGRMGLFSRPFRRQAGRSVT